MGGCSSRGGPRKRRVIAFDDSQEWIVHYRNSKATDELTVIDFFASCCGPCKYVEPFIDDLSKRYDVEFVKIEVDKLRDVAQEFGIEAMPTFILIKKGKEVGKLVGADQAELEEMIRKNTGKIHHQCNVATQFSGMIFRQVEHGQIISNFDVLLVNKYMPW